MNFIEEIKNEFRKYSIAFVGAVCLMLWLIFWLGQGGSNETSNAFCRWVGWFLSGTALVIELILAFANKDLITHWFDTQFDKNLTRLTVLAVLFTGSVIWIHSNWTGHIHNHTVFQGMLLWILAGHFF